MLSSVAPWDLIVKRNRNGYRGRLQTLLHDQWLPRWRTATNPFCSRVRQSSEPERTRSLPNRDLNLSCKNFAMKAPRDLGRGGSFEE